MNEEHASRATPTRSELFREIDEQAEDYAIAAAFESSEAADALAGCQPEDFCRSSARSLFSAIAGLHHPGELLDHHAVRTRLAERPADEYRAASAYFVQILGGAPFPSDRYAKEVQEASRWRRREAAVAEAMEACRGRNESEAAKALLQAEELLERPAGSASFATDGRLFDGITFAEDVGKPTPGIWGRDEQKLWTPGEAMMLYGPQGVAKTTLAQRLLLGRIGVERTVLGYPVQSDKRTSLYVAADRPRQAARSWSRMIARLEPDERELARALVKFWRGPLPFDIGTEPESLLAFMQHLGAWTLFADSLKDLAMDLTKDEVGSRVNRAWQLVIQDGREIVDIHHPRKTTNGEKGKPKSLDEVYGSTWLTAGHGSVVMLWGQPGDPIVELSHLKQPSEEVGPFRVMIDHERGSVHVHDGGDPLAILSHSLRPMAARDVARDLFGTAKPTDAEVEKARRRLERLCAEGLAYADRQGRDDQGRPKPVLYVAAAVQAMLA